MEFQHSMGVRRNPPEPMWEGKVLHSEAKEAQITKQIATWEDLVHKSDALDVVQHRINRM